MRSRSPRLIPLLAVLCGTAAVASQAPVAVSPGDTSKLALVEARCPTFSWGQVAGARSYELVVYRLGEESEEAETVLRQTFAGSVSSWTPSLDRCLERGDRYAWSVRAVGGQEASEWSAPSLFEVASGPSAAEFEEALQVVRSYLDAGGGAASSPGTVVETQAAPESASETEASSPTPSAVGTTQLSVDGGVVATSFTGDGSELTSLDPTSLTAGTAGIDISGNAATATSATTATDLACTDCVSVSELDFDPAVGGQVCPSMHCVTGLDGSGALICGACTPLVCGDGVLVQPGEECDDANAIDTDACLSSCLLATCGDGIVWIGTEQCDDGNTTTEECAYGMTSCTVCNSACQEAPGETDFCGDGTLDGPEQCDDGNTTTEECAYGLMSCTVCNSACQEAPGETDYCGDGTVDDSEECDDGGTVNGDGCSDACQIEHCVDGELNSDETDVDCGGSTCEGCAAGQSCFVDSDCLSNSCSSGTCA